MARGEPEARTATKGLLLVLGIIAIFGGVILVLTGVGLPIGAPLVLLGGGLVWWSRRIRT